MQKENKLSRAIRGTFPLAVAMTFTTFAMTQLAQAQETTSTAEEVETISVTGARSTRTTASINTDYIEAQAPGVAPQTLLRDLPGVNVTTSDPFGMYELINTVRMRGFTAGQIGMTIDGVPMDSTNNSEGGTIGRYVLTENLGGVDVSPGSGDVTQPAQNALGGAMRYFSRNPDAELGGKASFTLGSHNLQRSFIKVDTGELWEGATAYIAGARVRSTTFAIENAPLGNDHIEGKIRQEWGDNSLEFTARWDNRDDHDYQNVNLDFTPSASWTVTDHLTGDLSIDSDYYTFWANGRRTWLYNFKGDFWLTEKLNLKFTPYYERRHGYALYAVMPSNAQTAYDEAMAGVPGRTGLTAPHPDRVARKIGIRNGERTGLTFGLTWDITENNTLEFGGWYEDNDYENSQPYVNVDRNTGAFTNEVFSYDADYLLNTKTTQAYIKDTIRLLDDTLQIQFGAKALKVEKSMKGYTSRVFFNLGTYHDTLDVEASDYFQPQVGFSYDLNDTFEVFANYAENFSGPPTGLLTSNITEQDVTPETSKNIDLGLKASVGDWSGYIALYTIDYMDRIISVSANTLVSGLQLASGNRYINVGDVETKGAELSGEWKPSREWKFSTSLSYNKSIFANDYYTFPDASSLERTLLVEVKDNEVPGQPKLTASFVGGYQGEHFFANIDAKYTGRRHNSIMNVPAHETGGTTVFNGSVGWAGGNSGKFANMRFQLSVYNLLDKKYVLVNGTGQTSGSYKLATPRAIYASVEYTF